MVDKHTTPSPDYLTIREAAKYLGVSAQTLRRWDESDKLKPVRHPASAYRYYRRADLEPFRLPYQRAAMTETTTAHLFQAVAANIEENERLRDPQREAHRAVREHFATSKNSVILQIPVGGGKTGVIATLPFGIADGRVLVITPNLTIRKGVLAALDIASNQCFWTRTRVLLDYTNGPFAAVLDGPNANIHDCIESHFVVTNIQQLASSADRWLPQFPADFFDMILIDEGHHNVATSWRKVFERFPNAKTVSLTATPFRSDDRPLAGDVIYRYSFTRAMMKGYIKEIHATNVAPAEIYFTYKNDERRHTLDEVLKLREEAWFRQGVALAPECNQHIAEASIQKCRLLREKTGTRHQIIAVACSIDHARQVRSIFEQCGVKAKEIYGEMDEDEQDAVIAELRDHRIDCIVQVQMLGEGFDHPPLSVAAIFRPFRSLSPYIQFIGRVMRVIHEGEPGHADNHAFIVSHIGLNNDEQWDDFRELDIDDQKLFREWLTAKAEEELHEDGKGGGTPRRFDVGMNVTDEIISHFIDQSFFDPEDNRVLDKFLSKEVAPGLTMADLGVTRETLREKLRARQKTLKQTPQAIPVSPQRRRRAAKTRLAQRTGSVVARILKDLKLARPGREVGRAIATYRGQDNVTAVTRLLNTAINANLRIQSKQRNKPNADQAEATFAVLDKLGDQVRDQIKKGMR